MNDIYHIFYWCIEVQFLLHIDLNKIYNVWKFQICTAVGSITNSIDKISVVNIEHSSFFLTFGPVCIFFEKMTITAFIWQWYIFHLSTMIFSIEYRINYSIQWWRIIKRNVTPHQSTFIKSNLLSVSEKYSASINEIRKRFWRAIFYTYDWSIISVSERIVEKRVKLIRTRYLYEVRLQSTDDQMKDYKIN